MSGLRFAWTPAKAGLQARRDASIGALTRVLFDEDWTRAFAELRVSP